MIKEFRSIFNFRQRVVLRLVLEDERANCREDCEFRCIRRNLESYRSRNCFIVAVGRALEIRKEVVNFRFETNEKIPPSEIFSPSSHSKRHIFVPKQTHTTRVGLRVFPSPPTFIDPFHHQIFQLTFPLSFPLSLLFFLRIEDFFERNLVSRVGRGVC